MHSPLLHDSFFGRTVRYISKGKYFKHAEEVDPTLLKQYMIDTKQFSDSSSSSGSDSDIEVVEKGHDPTIVTWWGPEDPEKPGNWSQSVKAFVTFQICFLTFANYIGSSMYSAGIASVMKDFHIGEVPAILGLTVFTLGFGFGPMTLAPLSEVPAIGRNPVYIISLGLMVLLQIPTALAVNLSMLLVFRFITGWLGSPPLATGGACISELYSVRARAIGIAVWGISAIFGPVLGPLVGGFAAQAKGWRWTIWEAMWLGGFTLALLFFFFPETSEKNILYRRAQRLRKITGNPNLMTEAEIQFQHVTVAKVAQATIVRPWIITFTEPLVFFLNMYIALIFGLLFLWFEAFPLVFMDIYGFNLGENGLAFLGLLAGTAICMPLFLIYIKKVQHNQFDEKGRVIKPEMRLPPAIVGGFCLPVCIFWFAWTTYRSVHWIVPILGTMFFAPGALYTLNSVLTYLPDAYPTEIVPVMSGNCFLRFTFGAGFPLFAPAMFNTLGIHWACTLLGCLSLVYALIPIWFYFYGDTLRRRSKRARQD